MTTPPVFPNAELALRDWLRVQTDLVAALVADGSTSNDIDVNQKPALSCLVVYRAGGRPDRYIPTDVVVFGLDVVGKAPTGAKPPRLAAMDIQAALSATLWRLEGVLLTPGVRAIGCEIQSQLWSPYSDGRARYVNTAVIPIRSTALAA